MPNDDEGQLTRRNQILLFEYQTAQNSAEHHDALLWNVTAIIWGANLVLIGFVLQSIARPEARLFLILTAALGILLTVVVTALMWINNWVMRTKYKVCQRIEEKTPMLMQHHRCMDRVYPRFIQRGLYLFIVILFLAFWIIVLCRVTGGQAATPNPKDLIFYITCQREAPHMGFSTATMHLSSSRLAPGCRGAVEAEGPRRALAPVRVPALYPTSAFWTFLAYWAEWKINNLRALNTAA